MLLKIKELKGNELPIQIEPSDTVLTLKSKIESLSSIPVAEIKLLLSGKVLQDDKTLEEYKVSESSKIMLTRTKVDLKNLIQKALGKFYDAERASIIANLVVTNMKTRAQEYSLDDIERLAKSWNETK